MSERHTVEFRRATCQVVSDAAAGTLAFHLDNGEWGESRAEAGRLIGAIRRRFGPGPRARLARWWAGAADPLVLAPEARPHPGDATLIRLDAALRPGVPMDAALGLVLDFLRRQPDYRRTYGPPLDRDPPLAPRGRVDADASAAAQRSLRELFRRARRGPTD